MSRNFISRSLAARRLLPAISSFSALQIRAPPFLRHNSSTTWPLATTCRSPSCTCTPPPMPSFPDDLTIDHERKLLGSMPLYFRHIVIHTGRSDWPSKIEDDPEFPIAKHIKDYLKSPEGQALPGPIIVSYSSAHHKDQRQHRPLKKVNLTVYPEGKGSQWVQQTPEGVKDLMDEVGSGQVQNSTRQSPTILICGHGGRDARCGVLGPVLQAEFEKVLREREYSINVRKRKLKSGEMNAQVSLVSHVGGHALAGNVIIYWPGAARSEYDVHLPGDAEVHGYPAGIWYGRVEPKHVSGIVEALLDKGQLVKDLLRGYFVTTTKTGEVASGKLDHVYKLTDSSLEG